MQEYKFRAYDTEKKEWLFGYKEMGGFSLMGEVMMMGEWSSIPLERLKFIKVMQYTGFKDKKGIEIYEGDILRGPVITDDPVVFKAASLNCFHHWQEIEDALDEGKGIYVIGNVIDNPELLK